MSLDEIKALSLTFQYQDDRPDAGQKAYAALSALGLVGWIDPAETSQQHSVVEAVLQVNNAQVPQLADAVGTLTEASQTVAEMAARLLDASGASALLIDGELAAGTEVEFNEENGQAGQQADFGAQIFAGPKLQRSELAMSAAGLGGSWQILEHEGCLLAVRAGQPVDAIFDRKALPALELQRLGNCYQLRIHARNAPLNLTDSSVLDHWLQTGQRPVPAVAAGSAAAQLQREFGNWLTGIDAQDLKALNEAWPEAGVAFEDLLEQPDEDGLRKFVLALGLPELLVDLANGDPVPATAEFLRGGLRTGLALGVEEEIAGAKGIMKLVYRTGWSPAALITSSVAVLAAGGLLHRFMLRRQRPSVGWRRWIMFFWYSDAAYYLARGVRDALKKRTGQD